VGVSRRAARTDQVELGHTGALTGTPPIGSSKKSFGGMGAIWFSIFVKLACPKCGQSMFRAKHAGTEVDLCSGCHGLWLDRAELAAITGQPVDLPEPQTPVTTSLKCPRCGSPLLERAYSGRADLLVECCASCGGIYLDKGEMVVIKDLAKHPKG
jgi:Zn-finger nucleic acid-binding protein